MDRNRFLGREGKQSSTIKETPKTHKNLTGRSDGTGKRLNATRSREVTHEQIAARAFEIWLAHGRPLDQALEHWLQAERELHEKAEAWISE